MLLRSIVALALTLVSIAVSPLGGAEGPSQAVQLRIIETMSGLLRARIDQLPILLGAGQPVGKTEERLLTLNRDAVIVDGQRFDGIVVTAPAEKSSFAWAFASPANAASWYILREKGEMKGFANFLRQTRAPVPSAAGLKPKTVESITFQRLDSAAWVPNERYLVWFRFTDATPVEMTFRAGFFARPTLNNNALPALLFPPASTK